MPSDARDARTSFPGNTNSHTPRSQDKDKTSKARTMNGTLDGWIEPSLAGKPSFEDHGGAPYGVLEHMQPLGEPPSTRVRARVKGDGARKSLAGRSAAGTALDAQDTPEGTPGPLASSQTMVDAMPPLPPIPMDDEDDDDYAPGKKSKKKERVAKPRGSKRQSESAGPPAEGPSTGKGKGRSKKNAEKVVEKIVETPVVDATPDVINFNRIYNPMKLKSVVEEAKKRACDAGKPDLADAVEEIYQQSLKNARITELLEVILDQTATKEQTSEFQGYVRAAKKKLRLAKQAKQGKQAGQKVPATATNGDKVQPLPLRSPVKEAQPVEVKHELPAIPSTEKSEVPKPKFSIKVRSPPKPDTGRRTLQVKTTSSSPVKRESEQRDDDLSDLSELTELSEGEEMAIDTPEEREDMSAGPPSNVTGIKVKEQAAERGSLSVHATAQKRSSADAEIHETEDDRILSAKKLKLSGKVTREYDYQDSHIRSSLSGLPRAKNGAFAPAKITLHPNGGGNASGRGSRAISVDVDSPLSSPAGSSRRSTPHVWKGPPKQTGKRAKTKTSPEKKNQHAYGAMPGPSGAGRDSPIGDDDNEEVRQLALSPCPSASPRNITFHIHQPKTVHMHFPRQHYPSPLSENNDFCSSCRGKGFLLCCDGCDRSFHFACLDPPISEQASELNEPWFCFVCIAKRPITAEQPEKPARGLFAPLLNSLNKKNPETFELPEEIRNYFEGVSTASNGEFTEAVKPRTRRNDEKPDDYKLKDNKGNYILCYECHKSSLGRRPVITCDYCSQHWHLDCLDPPLANPPCRDGNGVKTGDWMCPLHVDHELRRVDTRLLKPAFLTRRIHIRKPRQAQTVETALQRGLQNNGIIEIADDDSDESDSEFYEDDRDPAMVYKMPAQGIKLDFIDKVKQARVQDYQVERLHKRIKLDNATHAPSALGQANFTRRSIREQQTALSLAQFSHANSDLNLSSDRVENLVGALIAEAPAQVIDTITAAEGRKSAPKNGLKLAESSPPNSRRGESLSPEHRRELEMLQELIKRKLQGSKS